MRNEERGGLSQAVVRTTGHSFARVILSTILAFIFSGVFLLVFLVLAVFFTGLPVGPQSILTIINRSSFLTPFILMQVVAQTTAYIMVPKVFYLRRYGLSFKDLGFDFSGLGRQVFTGFKIWVLIESTALVYDFVMVKAGLAVQGPGAISSITQIGLTTFLLIVLAKAILGSLGEEIFYRGYVFNSMLGKYGLRKAAILSALLFALLHGININSPILFIHGLIYAYFLFREKKVVPLVVAHSLKNILTLVFSFIPVILY